MSDLDSSSPEAFAPSLQRRRLQLRHSLTSPPALPSPLSHRHNPPASSAPRKTPGYDDDNTDDWESEDPTGVRHEDFENLDYHPPRKYGSLLSPDPQPSDSRYRSFSAVTARSPSPKPHHHVYPPRHRRNRSNDGARKEQRYIEHLERQMVELTNQLATYTEPSSHEDSHAAKMKKLEAENSRLLGALAEWESSFHTRVEDAVSERAAIDRSLRSRVGELEECLDDAEDRRKIAIRELAPMREKCRRLEERCEQLAGVEQENRSFEARIEALTEMLAESARAMQKPRERPRSQVFTKRVSLGAEMEKAASEGGESRRTSSGSSGGVMSDYGISGYREKDREVEMDDQEHSSSGETSDSNTPTPVQESRRRSFAFGAPMSPTLSQLSSTSTSSTKSRRMRRFPSGSSAPKTLILPSCSSITSPTIPYPPFHASSETPVSRPTSSASSLASLTSSSSYAPQESGNLFAELERAGDSDSDSGATSTTCSHAPSTRPSSTHPPYTRISESRNSIYVPVPRTCSRSRSPAPPASPDTPQLSILPPVITKVLDTFPSARARASSILSTGTTILTDTRDTLLTTRLRSRRGRHPLLLSPPTQTCEKCGGEVTFSGASSTGRRTPSPNPQRRVVKKKNMASGGLMQGQQAVEWEDSLDTMWMWLRVVVAVVVALGCAVREGPGSVVAEGGEGFDGVKEEERERALRRLEGGRVREGSRVRGAEGTVGTEDWD